jgi:hypothetical protein
MSLIKKRSPTCARRQATSSDTGVTFDLSQSHALEDSLWLILFKSILGQAALTEPSSSQAPVTAPILVAYFSWSLGFVATNHNRSGLMLTLKPTKSWSPVTAISQFWRKRIKPSVVSDLECCGEEEVERMAHDFRMSTSELRAVAIRGPESADLLLDRMAALDLDRNEVSQTQGRTFQDLQRVCMMCESRRRCARDLAGDSAAPAWKDYCPNATTLMALDSLPWAARNEW